jgi:phage replication O-like protein O
MSIESPQLEDGYTPVANTIMDPICRTRLSGTDWDFLHFLWRKTYGWAKPSDIISLSQFCEGTGLSQAHVCRTIKRLLAMNVIFRHVASIGNRDAATYEFNKRVWSWKSLPKLATLPTLAIQPLPALAHTITIEDTKSIVHIVGNSKKQRKFKVPHLIFDTETLQLSGIDDEARRAFAAACPKADLNDCLERLKAWIIKKGVAYENYWRTLCTIGGGGQIKGGINGYRQGKGYRPDIKDAVFTGENWIRSEHEHDADPTN